MKARTIFEHQELTFGEGDHQIPEQEACRLAAVAARSTLAGRSGNGVLDFGRNRLTARGVVGIVAAGGSVLEILPKIDLPTDDTAQLQSGVRRRLVHMLAVAFDLNVDVGSITEHEWQSETLLEILIRIFSEKLLDAVRHGMPRNYVGREEDLPNLRGRLDPRRQFSILAASPQKFACRYDALSTDTWLNRIMKAAVTRLSRSARSMSNQRRLAELAFTYADIEAIPAGALQWDKVILDRTNARWRDLYNLARLLLGERYQATSVGDAGGFSMLFEMNKLFEEYVARMLAKALAGQGLKVVAQGGLRPCLQSPEGGLFRTKPDILVKKGKDILWIIDTKWKRTAARLDDKKRNVAEADCSSSAPMAQI